MTEPDAYTIGWVPFLGATIFLDSRPLIPRVETEYWTELAIEDIKKRPKPRVLDLFSGSGCIGVAVLKHVPDAHVDFGEKVTEHLKTIERNIRDNGIPVERARIFACDVWNGISDRYDVILANPPYLSHDRIERIEESVLAYEPHDALFSDSVGYEHIAKTLEGLSDHLLPNGILYIEHEPEHADEIVRQALSLKLHASPHKDQYGVIRYSTVTFP